MEIQQAWYRISVKALIYNDKWEFLLCKEDNWVWDLPGGWLDHWENPIECIKRELLEEMWLEVTHTSEQPKYFITAHEPESKSRPWRANVFYEVKVKNLDFIPSEECMEIWFFNTETIKDIDVFVNVSELVKQLKEVE